MWYMPRHQIDKNMKSTLLIFIKNPVAGKVKTRLARTVGDAEALRIYHILLEKTRAAALEAPVNRQLWYSDQIEIADDWPEQLFDKQVQSGADLGERMGNAFKVAFAQGAEKVAIIGSDCPTLSGAILAQAFAALDTQEAAIGPTPDGGYYLLALRRFEPTLFENIAWSTETVFRETIAAAEKAGLRVAQLPQLSDIDTEADWRQYEALI